MNKRGLSLLAVIILIGFVVSLGVVVYLYLKNFTSKSIDEVAQEEACLTVNIRILEACYSNTPEDSNIKVKIESKSSRKIDKGFLLRLIGEKETLVPSLPFTVLDGLSIEDIVVPYSLDMGELNQVKVLPKIKNDDGSQVVCSLQADQHDISICA